MANVKKYLQDILNAIYGEEVRGSIHDAIEAINEESTNAEAVAISSRDSAKHNAESAEESATEAAASETAAKTSETNAKTSETAAKISETNAKASETAAKRSENNASDSEEAAYESEQNAKSSETAAKDSEDAAKASESAARTYSMQAFEYKHDAEDAAAAAYQYEQQCEQIRDDIGYPIDPKGTITFASLPSVSSAQIGWMYNISNDFTTTSDFEEGAGKFYSAGSEVYLNSNHKWSVMAGPGVTGIKGEAETTYHKGQVNLTKAMLGIDTLDDIDTPTFTQASTRANINSGETISTIMGKIKKFFADLKTVAFTGNASDVSFDNTGTSSSSTTVQAGLTEALTNSAPTASDVPYTNTTSGLSATNVQGAIDEVNNVKITLVTFSDLSKYGIATSGEKINATLQEICKKVPSNCEVKIHWTGNQQTDGAYRFGTLGQQMPEIYGALYIRKTAGYNPCAIDFIPYNSINHYVRNYDYVNSTDHLSNWTEIANIVPASRGGTGATTAKGAFNGLGYATDTSSYGPSDDNVFLVGFNNTFTRRPFSAIWNTIAGKIRSTFGFSTANVLPVANGGTGQTSLANVTVEHSTYVGTGNNIKTPYSNTIVHTDDSNGFSISHNNSSNTTIAKVLLNSTGVASFNANSVFFSKCKRQCLDTCICICI